MTYGRKVLPQTGREVAVLADLQDAQFKVSGITVDWTLFAVAGAASTLPDQTPIALGDKFARFGQILCKVTQSEIQTVNLSGDDDPTGGTFPLTILGTTLEDLAWNISAADLQTLIRAIDHPYAPRVTVAKAGFVYTITFPTDAGNIDAITSSAADLTGGGGDTFAVTILTSTGGVAGGGKYGPYDPDATDGRQTLSRGNCFILNRTVKENGHLAGLNTQETDHPQIFDGGTVWKDRILMTTGTHSLAAGPTVTEFETAFPRIAYAG
jgi:hypothetical protein